MSEASLECVIVSGEQKRRVGIAKWKVYGETALLCLLILSAGRWKAPGRHLPSLPTTGGRCGQESTVQEEAICPFFCSVDHF